MDPLSRYRRAQRAARAVFDPLTERLCPQCPDPCCRVPARVTPFDAALAAACGWRPPAGLGVADPEVAAALQLFDALADTDENAAGKPCPFLEAQGCAFPSDLRPYGCTAFVCRFMREALTARERAQLRGLLHRLDQAYAELRAAAGSGGSVAAQKRHSGGQTSP